MSVLKCKMCGGDISVNADMTVGTCQYCGSVMTLPHIDSDKKARLFNRANEYRRNNEFDKAYDAYNLIAAEDGEEPEAYWGMLLSEYGVEYVEDPSTKKMIPTCHRTKTGSVVDSSNYKLAYERADIESKLIYKDEAEEIDRIQRKILAISKKEDPYDIFICYKETDENGERTQDSVLAYDIYNELVKQGFRVFYSKISLENKLGVDYEPYIYAALNSAKVLLVVSTSSDNVEAVWVKNEWNRYLRFMEDDNFKTLIPVFKDMDVTELPKELSSLQGVDFSKVGAMQDLIHAITKLLKNTSPKAKKRIPVVVLLGAACALLLILIVLTYRNSDAYTYKTAKTLYEKGEYSSAAIKFSQIMDYKDSQVMYGKASLAAESEELLSRLSDLSEQEETTLFESEWTVIEKNGSSIVLMKNDSIDKMPYVGNDSEGYGWEQSNLRTRLNESYLKELKEYPEYYLLTETDSYGDMVRVLSEDEANKYFVSKNKKKISKGNGCWLMDESDDENGCVLNNYGEIVSKKKTEYAVCYPIICLKID